MFQPVVHHNSVARVPLTHHQTKMTSTRRDNGDKDWFHIFIILYLFQKALFYRFPTSISFFTLASCDFPLGTVASVEESGKELRDMPLLD